MNSLNSRNDITGNHGSNPKKQKQKWIRTWSSDSGCDTDMAASIMDESIQSWTSMLEKVVRQEAAKAKEITNWTKEDIENSWKGNLFSQMLVCYPEHINISVFARYK
jgi:hypothetical protein